ncbi:MAG TPA: DUF2207 domain-containing protein [Terriglobales bacterium]|jgi:uncharacterized membrane protein|nr:DUF2207 domain-containing protein [Terriglobales bacterium]
MFGGAHTRCELIVCLFLLLSLTASAAAQARNWRVTDFNDTISIAPDGTALVSEKITLAFVGQWHGIHRTIPVEYPGPEGTNYTLFLKIINVTDENGSRLKYDSSKSGTSRDLKIYIPDAVDTTRVVNIDYSVRNGVRFFGSNNDSYAEFYWNVTGNDWPVPIDHASAFVTLPENAAAGLRAQAFTGAYGSKESEVSAEVKGSDVVFETTRALRMRAGLTIDIYVPQGVIKPPSALAKLFWFLGGNPIVFLPLLTFAVMLGLWYSVGRDPDPGVSVAPQYEPPQGMSPAEAGTLIDDTIHPRDITSTIIDLAVRGYIKIEEKIDTFLLFHHKDYLFTLLKPREQWGSELAPHERVMLENIFLSGTGTRLSDLKNRFYIAIPVVREDIMSALKSKGIYTLDPESANGYSIVAGVVIAILVIGVQIMGWMNLFYSILLVIGSVLVSALIWWLFARQMTAKTVTGARTRIAVLGFQEFMNRVDSDRIKRMPPDTFEKFLPYAMALGVEHHWAQAFDGIIKDPPSWYVSPNGYVGFSPLFFSSSMHSMASDMHQVFVSAPRASSGGSGFSSGGGFSGGGFSGGGFGGGGGGAF